MQISKEQLKELIDKIGQAVQKGAEVLEIKTDVDFESATKAEIARFLMYLAASDGEIQWSEASCISYLFDLNFSPQTLATFIRENNIYSTEFENQAPATFKFAVGIDNKLYESNVKEITDADYDLPKALISVYQMAANFFINVDGDEAANELADLKIYLNMMNSYYDENTARNKESVSGFSKNTASGVTAPTKSGVPAPQKR